jgi:3-hydroxybutyryl-CoA dehydrogenase
MSLRGNKYIFYFRTSEHNVVVYDVNSSQLDKSKNFIKGLLDKEITKGTLKSDERSTIDSRFKFSTNLNDFQECQFAIEAATENLEIKQKIIKSLDDITKPSAIIASNTSSISITKLASFTKRPNQVIGMHFMNPVPIMKLVEIIRGLQTDDETFKKTAE